MKRVIALTLAGTLLLGHALAQSKAGTTIGQFLLIEPSARVAAMGGAGVTSSSEVFAAYDNPGALGQLLRSEVQFAHNTWYAGITLNHAEAAIKMGSAGTALLSMTNLSSGDISVTTVDQPQGTGERYTVNDLALGLGYGFRVTDRFSCGVQVNYVEERIWHSSVSVVGMNVGTLYELRPNGLRIGASLSNFGSRNRFQGTDLRVRYDLDPRRFGDNSSIPADLSTDDFGLPILFRVGVSYPLVLNPSNVIRVAADAFHPNDNSESVSLGMEYEWNELLAVRIGYQNLFLVDSEVGFAAGAGLLFEEFGYNVRFDYAWAAHNRLGDTQRIAVAFGF